MRLIQLPSSLHILLFTAAASAVPIPHASLQTTPDTLLASKTTTLWQRHEHKLPPVSEVIRALEEHSMWPSPAPRQTPALVPRPMDDFVAMTSSSTPEPTVPYTGPGMLILPNLAPSSVDDSAPTQAPEDDPGSGFQGPPGTIVDTGNHPSSSPIHHLVFVGGIVAGIILFTTILFFLMDPCIWRPCCAARRERRRLARLKKARQRPLPSWMRVKPSYSLPDEPPKEKGTPTLSPFQLTLSDDPQSKFSVSSSDFGFCGELDVSGSSDANTSAPPSPNLPQGPYVYPPTHNTLSLNNAASSGRSVRFQEPAAAEQSDTPSRPPRPPTPDSPAAIESIYYTDVNDKNFYRHPNPVILDRTNPSITKNNFLTVAGNTPQLRSKLSLVNQPPVSDDPDTDHSQRNTRRYSSPGYSLHSKSDPQNTGPSDPIQVSSDADGTRLSGSSTKAHRKSRSVATVWTWNSELRQQQQRGSNGAPPGLMVDGLVNSKLL